VLSSGTPKSYVKTAESGNKRRHAFCGDCGAPIYACAVDNPQTYALRVGTITQRAALLTAAAKLAAFCAALGRRARYRAGGGERVTRWVRALYAAAGSRDVAGAVGRNIVVADLIENASTPCT
jgi:hypothetical protein